MQLGTDYAISSLAVLQERDKIRVLHDATHKTCVNHKIRVRDQLRMPGFREKQFLMRKYMKAKQHPIAVMGDFASAHRLVKIVPADWGFQACRTKPGQVWINLVGTFGVASASFWWARLSGCLVRGCFGLLGPLNPIEILLFADDIELLGVDKVERRSIILAIFYLTIFGSP